jgi:hypothetical protein
MNELILTEFHCIFSKEKDVEFKLWLCPYLLQFQLSIQTQGTV